MLDGGETRVPSLTLPPELPLDEPPEDPDDPEDELLDVVPPLRGPACAQTVTGTAKATVTANAPNACIDLVMATSPLDVARRSLFLV